MKPCKVLISTLSAIFVCVLLFPAEALACACCAEPGTYSISTKKPGNNELGELKRIQFDTAFLYTEMGGEDDIKGISPISDSYLLTSLFQTRFWNLTFKNETGKTGTLKLPIPTSMVAFDVDIHDGKEYGAGGPALYKEWRFKSGITQGTGIFQKGIRPGTTYFLVFQGRGNACTSAENFTQWRLEITGKGANYAFWGDLKSPK